MGRIVATGVQDFEKIITGGNFYIDKTGFIREWWESGDEVTLITRPRRFGKTLNMSMLNCFFSNQYAGRGELFQGLSIWKYEAYHLLQGTYPVISLSFADVNGGSYTVIKEKIWQILTNLYSKYYFLRDSEVLTAKDRDYFDQVSVGMMGLMVDLGNRYHITSNRESGYGRYDILLEPLTKEEDGIIIEFKVHDKDEETTLEDTVASALAQIEEKSYEQTLLDKGVSKERIRKYGFAFQGKKVLIG